MCLRRRELEVGKEQKNREEEGKWGTEKAGNQHPRHWLLVYSL